MTNKEQEIIADMMRHKTKYSICKNEDCMQKRQAGSSRCKECAYRHKK